jgi:hypothetical protein
MNKIQAMAETHTLLEDVHELTGWMAMLRNILNVLCTPRLLFTALHFAMTLSTLVILLVIASEAKEELSDAAVTLDDVRKIVPEIRQSLGILKTLCNNFPDYCN